MRAVKWMGGSLAALAFLFTAIIGFAHTRPGRPVLRLLSRIYWPKGVGCPFGYDKLATSAQRETARAQFARTHAGAATASARPALGFALDVTTRADVMAWAQSQHVECSAKSNGNDLGCTHVAKDLLPPGQRGLDAADLWFDFGSRGTLISLAAVFRSPSAAPVSAAFTDFSSAVSQSTGVAPTTTRGSAAAADLSAGVLRQASVEYRFRNYYARARATNLGHGFMLTEELRSLPAATPASTAVTLR